MSELTNLINDHLRSKSILDANPSWIIKKSDLSGRGLFASRDIQEGDVIFVDNTLIIGPRSSTKCPIMCVSCYEMSHLYPCSRKCGLPVCSNKCEDSTTHRKECGIVLRWKKSQDLDGLNLALIKCLTPVRSLLLDDNQKRLLIELKSHSGSLHGFEVDILKEKLGLVVDEEAEDFMRLACTILDANSFEVIIGKEDQYSGLRGLYPLSSLMNHTCTPNTMHNFDIEQRMIVKATTFIPKGQEMFHSYTRFIWGTTVRRSHLVRTKHFFCTCPRCEDPTELGTNLSAINCWTCSGLVLPFYSGTRISWRCTSCNEEMPKKKTSFILTLLGSRLNSLSSLDVDPEDILGCLKKTTTKYIPPFNQIAVELKYRLVWILGYKQNYLWNDLSDDLLNEKENICRELLQLLATLKAGQSKMKGLLLYELYCCLRERHRRAPLESKGVMSEEVRLLFDKSRKILTDDVNAPEEIKNYAK